MQLAKVLSSGGNVLLLDEPTNDLDVDTLRALEDALLGFPGCAVVISHDRWFLDRIATHVLAFEGDSEVRWWEGNFSDYEADRQQAARASRPTSPTASATSRSSATERTAPQRPRGHVQSPLTSTYGVAHGGPSATHSRGGDGAVGHPDEARRPRPERLEVHAVGRVRPFVALGDPVVGQDATERVHDLVAPGRQAEGRRAPGRP